MLIRRRAALGLIGAGALAPSARAAAFDWKRYNGARLRFMVSVHPWTQWAQGQLPALERDTGIKVGLGDPVRGPASPEAAAHAAIGSRRSRWLLHTAVLGRRGVLARRLVRAAEQVHPSDLTAPDWDFADFFPNILKIHQQNGVQIGIPITIELQALFINKAMLAAKQLAVPTTLDALMDTAKALNDPGKDLAGIVTRGDGVQAVYTFAPFLFAFGGRWLDDKGQPELAYAAAMVSALKYYGELLRTAGPPNILGMQWKTTYPLFQQAHAAMFIDATNFLAYFKDPTQSRIVDQVGVATLPAGPAGEHSTVISWGPAIAASSKQQAGDLAGDPVPDVEGGNGVVHPGDAPAAVAPVDLQQRCVHEIGAAGYDRGDQAGDPERGAERRQPAGGPGARGARSDRRGDHRRAAGRATQARRRTRCRRKSFRS